MCLAWCLHSANHDSNRENIFLLEKRINTFTSKDCFTKIKYIAAFHPDTKGAAYSSCNFIKMSW